MMINYQFHTLKNESYAEDKLMSNFKPKVKLYINICIRQNNNVSIKFDLETVSSNSI